MVWALSSARPRPASRCNNSASATSRLMAASSGAPSPARCSSSALAWATLRGKPSSRNPWAQSGWPSRSSIIATTTWSGTSSPESRYAWATSPSGVPSATLARRMSPVARCTSWNRVAIRSAWVPLPAPGGPSNTTRMRLFHPQPGSEDATWASRALNLGLLVMRATLGSLGGGGGLAEGGLAGGQAGRGHPERRAGHVVQAQLVAEPHRVGVAAVLAADPQVQVRAGLAALLAGDPHQPAHPGLVDGHERVDRDQLALLVQAEELADVVAGEPEGGLGEVVGAEGEELGHLGDLARDQGRPGQLDHGPPQHLELLALVLQGLAGHRLQLLAHLGQLLTGRGQRVHDLHDRVAPL